MIKLYNTPLSTATEIDQIDVFTGNVGLTRFTMVNKLGSRIGDVAQINGTQYPRSTGKFTVEGNDIVFASAPPVGAKIVVPGITRARIKAYDQSVVEGVVNPLIGISRLVLADIEEIGLQLYTPSAGESGMKISIIDNDALYGAQASWVSFAREVDGAPGTFGATGADLLLPAIENFSNLSANASALDTTITVDDGTQFVKDSYIHIDYGTARPESVLVTNVTGNVLTVSALNENHTAGAYVYHSGWPFYARVQYPIGVSGGTNINLYDLDFDLKADFEAR